MIDNNIGFNLDNIFGGVVTAVQGVSDTVQAFNGEQNRRELAHPSLQGHIPINIQTGLPMMGYQQPQLMGAVQQPYQDYSNIGYENQGYPQASVYQQYGMVYPQSHYQNQMQSQHLGHYDPAYG